MEVCLKSLSISGIESSEETLQIKTELKGTDQFLEVAQVSNEDEPQHFTIPDPEKAVFKFTVIKLCSEGKEAIRSIELGYQDVNGTHQFSNGGSINIQFEQKSPEEQKQEAETAELGQPQKLTLKTRETRNRNYAELLGENYDAIHEEAMQLAEQQYENILKQQGAPFLKNQEHMRQLKTKIDQFNAAKPATPEETEKTAKLNIYNSDNE